jgi:hypothetical protein
MVRTFLLKIGTYTLPFALMLAVPVAVLMRSGELVPLRAVVERQQRESLLYGPAYSSPFKSYKVAATRRHDPETLILGSSRVMQFRSAFFVPPERVYNAGGSVSATGELRRFVSRLPASSRRSVLVVGLDQWWFNPLLHAADIPDAEYTLETEPFNLIQQQWQTVWGDVWRGKIKVASLLSVPAYPCVGMNALANRNGFLSDGSYYSGSFVAGRMDPDGPETHFAVSFANIEGSTYVYRRAETVSLPDVDELKRFIEQCKNQGLFVVGLLPPFAPQVARRLTDDDGYAYLSALPSTLRTIFDKYGYPFFDFTDAAALGASDTEFIDGLHGSDKVSLRMLVAMARNEPRLAARVDIATLKRRLDETTTNYVVTER